MPFAILLNDSNKINTANAKSLAQQLQLAIVSHITDAYDCYLCFEDGKLGCLIPHLAQKPYFVDFLSGQLAQRQIRQSSNKELIVKACTIKNLDHPLHVIDATAGFGRDAFILAASGAIVTLLEKNPIVATLLADGLTRLQAQSSLFHMTLQKQNTISYLKNLTGTLAPDIIYLDPMFEEVRHAKVKKDLQLLQWLNRDTENDDIALFTAAQRAHVKRIIVKRAIHAATLTQQKPSFSLEGKHTRFDVYVMPE